MESIDPNEIIYSITMQSILTAIENRLGKEALALTTEDIQLARDEFLDRLLIFAGYYFSSFYCYHYKSFRQPKLCGFASAVVAGC